MTAHLQVGFDFFRDTVTGDDEPVTGFEFTSTSNESSSANMPSGGVRLSSR